MYKLQNPLHFKLLIGILLLAAMLRFQGIFWGIPLFDPMVHSYHPDEPKIIHGAINFPHHILNNTDLRYPTFYHYFLGVLSIPVKILFKITRWPFEDFQLYVSVLGRFISILLGLGSILLTFLLGKKLYNEKVGLLSALFLSLSLYHIQNSSWATLDVPNSFFFILTLYSAFKMHEEATLKFYLLTGISLGILIGTKYTGAIVIILILILHFYRSIDVKKNLYTIFQAAFSKKLWLLFLSAGVIFLITTPTIIMNPTAFINSISELLNIGPGKKYGSAFNFSILISIIKNLAKVTDPILTSFTILGLVFPFRKSWNKEIPMIITVIIFSIAFGVLTSRHLIAILPVTSILGAQAIFYLRRKLTFISKPIWIFLLILWITFAVVYNSAGIYLRKGETRSEAAYYIEKNIPEGSSIGAASIGNYLRFRWMLPKIDETKYKIADPLEKPDFIILTSYDYVAMEKALLSYKLHNYVWDPRFSYEWYRSHPPSEEVFNFYDNILNHKGEKYKYRLIKKFEKDIFVPIEFPPPQIKIYERTGK